VQVYAFSEGPPSSFELVGILPNTDTVLSLASFHLENSEELNDEKKEEGTKGSEREVEETEGRRPAPRRHVMVSGGTKGHLKFWDISEILGKFFGEKDQGSDFGTSEKKPITRKPFYEILSAHQSGVNSIDIFPKVSKFQTESPKISKSLFWIMSGGDDENIFTASFKIRETSSEKITVESPKNFSTKSTHCSAIRGITIAELAIPGAEKKICAITTGPDQILAVWSVEGSCLKLVKDFPVSTSHAWGLALLPRATRSESLEAPGVSKTPIEGEAIVAVVGQGIHILDIS
jgi:hypothetical protein